MPLSTTPDWRWLFGREDNPWYPTMRIFQEQTFLDWAPVFDRIAIELRKLIPNTVPTRSVVIETVPGELLDNITILDKNNDRRAAIKRQINERLGSHIVEERSYAAAGRRCTPECQ